MLEVITFIFFLFPFPQCFAESLPSGNGLGYLYLFILLSILVLATLFIFIPIAFWVLKIKRKPIPPLYKWTFLFDIALSVAGIYYSWRGEDTLSFALHFVEAGVGFLLACVLLITSLVNFYFSRTDRAFKGHSEPKRAVQEVFLGPALADRANKGY